MSAPRIQVSGDPGEMGNYLAALAHAGGEGAADYCPAPDLSCAGLLLCGGGDVDCALYGQEDRGSQPPDHRRDQAELDLFRAFYQAGKPILGICRGMQVINIALGGDLIQDLPRTQGIFHVSHQKQDSVHPLRTAPEGLLHRWYGPLFSANSCHHQAVDRLGAGLVPLAWAESGFVEALAHQTRPILGVQFHPERMSWDRARADAADGRYILDWLIAQCPAH